MNVYLGPPFISFNYAGAATAAELKTDFFRIKVGCVTKKPYICLAKGAISV